MNLLLTGGLGLIGHNLARRLLDLGHDVSITDTRSTYGFIPQQELDYLIQERKNKIPELDLRTHRIDVSDRSGIDWLCSQYKPDVLIHLASFPRQKIVNVDPALGSRTMSEGLLNLLEAAKHNKIQRFVYISSSMVYGDFEDFVTEDAECRPQGQYGIMKLAGEWLVRDYSRRGCFEHVIIRPSAVYGESDVSDRVVSKFMLAALRDDILQVNGANETLDFTYVDDAANGIASAATSNNTANKIYNITKSHSHSLLDAAKLAQNIAGKGRIEIGVRDKDFPSRGALNIDAARRDFDFDPKIDVEQGFQKYHDWFLTSEYWNKKL